jgi:hypothetical protein
MTDANRKKFIPPSDYDRSITKSYEKKKSVGSLPDATSKEGLIMLGVEIKDEDYFHGEDAIWLRFEEFYQLYHQDTLDISFMST